MAQPRNIFSRRYLGTSAILLGIWGTGCTQKVQNFPTVITPRTIAVAPVLNFSGEMSLDPVKAADLLASELSYVDGITVLPVSRVLAVLSTSGTAQVESPAHALAVADAVGADGILVAGITEYDAYTPTVGVVLQSYSTAPMPAEKFDAVAASRLAQPFEVTRMADPSVPTSQVQIVYNGSHESIQEAIRAFAQPRTTNQDILGWRQYLKVQPLYLRFCWHESISRLMRQELARDTFFGGMKSVENPT